MATLKRDASGVDERTPFDIYDGPEPRKGVYPGRIEKCVVRKSGRSENLYYNVLVILDAPADSPKAQYNGYPAWVMVTMANTEANLAREAAFMRAVCGKTSANVVLDGNAPKEPGQSNEVAVKSIGGKNPIGTEVRVDIGTELYEGVTRPKPDSIYPANTSAATAATPPDDADETEEEVDEDEDITEDEEGFDADTLRAELAELSLLKLKKAAVEDYGIPKGDLDGASRDDIIDAILDVAGGPDANDEVEDVEDEEVEDETEEETSGVPAYSEASSMSLPKLRKFAEELEYDPADLKSMSKEEILEQLVTDEAIGSPDDDPPF